ncbi:uncharacterized protein At4g04775-like [Brassica napus]|uniref:uncharacterized protein At4g04775-like n=1 Tax=Brassica napus TaxID=3708 RepID=UPI00207A9A16|nr:uncharacterized protein At4g04775-like [Brassica napus]
MVGPAICCVGLCREKKHSRPKVRKKNHSSRRKAISLHLRFLSIVDLQRPTNMGQDYSYTQPSSEEFDINSLLEAEAALYGDEAQSSYIIAEADQYPPEPEADEGIPRTCYCGSEVVVETSYTRKDPGSRYFSCNNVDDGDSHIWKWWDVAIQEELRETQTQLRMVKDQFFESDQKVAKLDKIVGVLTKKTSVINYGLAKGVSVLVLVILVIVMGW